MAGKRQKHPNQLQGHRRVEPLDLLPGAAPQEIPEPPEEISAAAREAWEAFFSSPIAATVDIRADGPALRRWVHALTRHELLAEAVAQEPTVAGSMGQDVINPRHAILLALTREIERIEEHFGMTPLARLRLGITLGVAAASIRDLQNSLKPPPPEVMAPTGVIDLDEL